MSKPNVPPIPQVVLHDIVERALLEDLGRGDLTTDACVPMSIQTEGVALRAREALVLSGIPVVQKVFELIDRNISVQTMVNDGSKVSASTVVARISGPANSILKGERVALNFIQRMSGIASKSRAFCDALPPESRTRITDTRKTTPGLRAFERYAVRCGGAHNHREDLGAAVLIKDNHIAACGSIAAAVGRARQLASHTSKIECEVDTMAQLEEALIAGADIVMLDNFSDKSLAEAVTLVDGRAFIEVSGGVTLARIATIAEAGVDAISVGALTHGARSVDLGLDWI